MLMHNRKGTTIVTQQEKVTNETQQQMNNLFRTLCSVRSFCCRESIFSYLRRAVFILSQAKSTTNRFLEFFLKLLSRYNRLSKKSFVRFLYGAGPVANLSLAWPLRDLKRLAPLAKKLVKLDFAVVSMGFSEALSSFSHFS